MSSMHSVYVLPLQLLAVVLACVISDYAIRKLLTPWSTHIVWFHSNRQTWKYSLHLIFTFFLNRDPSVLESFLVIVFQYKRFSVLAHLLGPFGNRNRLWRSYRYILLQTRTHMMINQHNSVLHVFSVPTDQECAELLMYWQFFYYHPPGKFWYTAGETPDNRYGFSISVQPEITPLSQFIFNV